MSLYFFYQPIFFQPLSFNVSTQSTQKSHQSWTHHNFWWGWFCGSCFRWQVCGFTFLLSSKFSHFVIFYSLEDNIDNQDHGKNTTKPARKYGPFVPFVKKKSGATQDVESDNVMYIAFTLLSSLLFLLLLPQNRNYTTPYTISCQSNQWEETCCSQ